jgi:hypothetical protein
MRECMLFDTHVMSSNARYQLLPDHLNYPIDLTQFSKNEMTSGQRDD